MSIKFFTKSAAVGTLALLFVAGLPGAAFADDSNATTTSDSTLSGLQSELQSLLSQVSSLEAQIRALGGTPSFTGAPGGSTIMMQHPGGPGLVGACEMFTHALVQGDSDNNTDGEVSQLQTILKADPTVYPSGQVTGFFGPLTAAAVANFQMKNGIITASSSAAGVVGPQTRGFLFSACGHLFGGNGEGNGNGNGNGGGEGSMGNGGVVAGTISAVNGSTSITVTSFLAGATKTVDLTPSTQVYVWSGSTSPSDTSGAPTPTTAAIMAPGMHMGTFTQGSMSDLVIGKGVVVLGTPNSDGTITASRVNVGIPLPPIHPPMQSTSESDNQGSDN